MLQARTSSWVSSRFGSPSQSSCASSGREWAAACRSDWRLTHSTQEALPPTASEPLQLLTLAHVLIGKPVPTFPGHAPFNATKRTRTKPKLPHAQIGGSVDLHFGLMRSLFLVMQAMMAWSPLAIEVKHSRITSPVHAERCSEEMPAKLEVENEVVATTIAIATPTWRRADRFQFMSLSSVVGHD